MLSRASLIIKTVLSTALTLTYGVISTSPLINDTVVVAGSLVHATNVKAFSVADPISAAASNSANRRHDDIGFENSLKTDDRDDDFGNFKSSFNKDDDDFGYAEHYKFDKKDSDKNGGGYRESRDFIGDDENEAAGSPSPKYTRWHFEKIGETPGNARSYHYRGDGSGDFTKGKLVGPGYEEDSSPFFNDDEPTTANNNKGSKRSKRKKEPRPSAATEYDNYEYADVEEPDEGEAEEGGDPEYGAIYADADAYDYY